LSENEFELIHQRILDRIVHSPVAANELERNFSGIPKEKFWEVFDFLKAENKLSIDGEGMVRAETRTSH
jgi:hypothetical protein